MTDKSLYTPEEVQELIAKGSVVLIDIRDPAEYNEGHIQGAINIPEVFYSLSESSAQGLAALHKKFQNLFSQAGVSHDKDVIFYEDSLDSRYGGACRGYWLITYLGHPRAGILYGGFTIWLEKNFQVNKEEEDVKPTVFTLNIQHHLMATKRDVLKALHDPSIKILDNRDRVEWLGRSSSPYGPDFAPRKGRIPGARWIEWYQFMEKPLSFPVFKSKKEIRSLCESHGIYPTDDVIIYCFKGSRAANTYIALKESGFQKVRVYLGSWNEWSRDFVLPIEEGAPESLYPNDAKVENGADPRRQG